MAGPCGSSRMAFSTYGIAASGRPRNIAVMLRIRYRSRPAVQRPRANGEIAGTRVGCLFLIDAPAGLLHEFKIKRPRETAGDLALRFREVGTTGVEPVGPDVRAALGIDQLHIHFDLIIGPADAAFKNIANAELAADLLGIDGFALVDERRVAGDHKASGNPREIGGQIVSDTVGEIFLVRVVRQVRKRQNDDRQARRRGARDGWWNLRARCRGGRAPYRRGLSFGPRPPARDRDADHGDDAGRDGGGPDRVPPPPPPVLSTPQQS